MTQEEKNKRYDEALERAKKLQKTCDSTAVVGWCDQHPRWIGVEDELPKMGEDVLILTPQNLVHIAAYKYRDLQTKAHVFVSGIDGYSWNNITHWMPLPLPPAKLSSLERNGKN